MYFTLRFLKINISLPIYILYFDNFFSHVKDTFDVKIMHFVDLYIVLTNRIYLYLNNNNNNVNINQFTCLQSVYKEIKNMLPITRYIAHSSLKTVGVQILIRIKVQDYLLGYRDDIFTIIGNLHAVFNGDEKHLPKEFGILQKVELS